MIRIHILELPSELLMFTSAIHLILPASAFCLQLHANVCPLHVGRRHGLFKRLLLGQNYSEKGFPPMVSPLGIRPFFVRLSVMTTTTVYVQLAAETARNPIHTRATLLNLTPH